MNASSVGLALILFVTLEVPAWCNTSENEKATNPSSAARIRLLILTDIGYDPVDQQSIIRLMLYTNYFDIEGLIASAAGIPGELKADAVKPELIWEIVEAYGRVRENLALHDPRYPIKERLLECVK